MNAVEIESTLSELATKRRDIGNRFVNDTERLGKCFEASAKRATAKPAAKATRKKAG